MARVVATIVVLLSGCLMALALVFPDGRLTGPIEHSLRRSLGWAAPVAPLWLIVFGALAVRAAEAGFSLPWARLVGLALVSVALPPAAHLLLPSGTDVVGTGAGGGAIGQAVAMAWLEALGSSATAWSLIGLMVAGTLLLFKVRPGQIVAGIVWGSRASWRISHALAALAARGWKRCVPLLHRRHTTSATMVSAPEPLHQAIGRGAKQGWALPPLNTFRPGNGAEPSPVDLRARARVIEETLASFNIEARVIEVNPGPAVTQFGLEPAPGVAVNRVLARGNDLALRLGASPLRMEAPVPGKRVIGLEVPNAAVATVTIRDLLESEEFHKVKSRLRLALGRDVSGRPVVGDLARMPHLLIAGATGSGKSVCLNTIIASLLVQSTPDDLQFLIIDPKMVELVGYSGIPHLRMPVVTDMERVVGALKWAVREMERRYGLFSRQGARNLEAYNRATADSPTEARLPFLVIVIDELADMMMTAADEVERTLCRLAQLGRAAGIHLVVATQRPSVDVLTGLIKANFVARIAFAVSAQVDSRVILDGAGAEKLLGRGDMLYVPADVSKPIRVQGAYVSDQEIQDLVAFWQRLGEPRYSEEDVQQLAALGRAEDEEDGELYARAEGLAQQFARVSVSLLQRRLGIGYPRAARLLDLMEQRGVVTPLTDSKSREVVMRAPAEVD